jgi:hypothetical protein
MNQLLKIKTVYLLGVHVIRVLVITIFNVCKYGEI